MKWPFWPHLKHSPTLNFLVRSEGERQVRPSSMNPVVIHSVLSTFGHFHTFSFAVWKQWPLTEKSCIDAQLTCEHIGSWQGLFWRLWETWRPVFWRTRWQRDLLLLLWSPGQSSHEADRPLFLVKLGLLWTGLESILWLNHSIVVNRQVGLKYQALKVQV